MADLRWREGEEEEEGTRHFKLLLKAASGSYQYLLMYDPSPSR